MTIMRPEDRKVATLLHTLFCDKDHEETCGWYLEEEMWKGKAIWTAREHARWFKKAQAFLNTCATNNLGGQSALRALNALVMVDKEEKNQMHKELFGDK